MQKPSRARLGTSTLAACSLLAASHTAVVLAADVPIISTKLVIVDRVFTSGQAKAVFTAKDPAITKGTGTNPATISAVLGVAYEASDGQFAMPPGSGWAVNSPSVAKYVNQAAPAGGAVKVGVVKPGTALKVVGKSLGDDPIDISTPPGGTVAVAYIVTNGTETIRHCTAFTGCTHKVIAGGTGRKLVCKNGTGDASCGGAVPPVCGDGALVAGESCDPPGAPCDAGLLCDNACRCHLCGNGQIEDGEQCDDDGTVPGDGCDAVCRLEEIASSTGTVTTDDEGDGTTPTDPVETTVTSPVGGTISILETSGSGDPPAGLGLLGRSVSITAPTASASAPLVLEFLLDQTLMPNGMVPEAIIVFRAGVSVPPCTGSTGVAAPDPCVASRTALPGGDIAIIVLTSHASPWGFGANVAFTLTSTPLAAVCGTVRAGGAGGTIAKSLMCGGLSVGGGTSTFVEARFRTAGRTELNGTCDDVACAVSGRSATETGSDATCSVTGCPFGPYLPVANAGVSLCLRPEFTASASGTLDHTLGAFAASVPLASRIYLTANAVSPCPKCIGGTPGAADSGMCDPSWLGGIGSSPDLGAPCTPVNAAGDTYDCRPPAAADLGAIPLSLTPATTGSQSLAGPGGGFCPGQSMPGAFGCAGSGSPSANCPGGNVPPVPDHIEVAGAPAGAITPGPHALRLASAFCIPAIGGPNGFLVNSAASLPGPGALTLPATIEVVSVTTSTSTTTTTLPPFSGRVRLRSGTPGASCGSVRTGGAAGAVVKTLSCGGLNVGGGISTFVEEAFGSGALTEMHAECTGSLCTLSGLDALDTGSNDTCSADACRFGPYLPVSNAGTSLCVEIRFTGPASGALDPNLGTFDGTLPLASNVHLTGNAVSPCPRCIGGTVGVVGSGVCDANWTGGSGPSPDSGAPCTPVNVAGDTYDCTPSSAAVFPAIPLGLSPLTTGTASLAHAAGLFCPTQVTEGAFGCRGSGSASTACPGGNLPPVPDYVGIAGTPAGTLTPGTHPIKLASAFCVPAVVGPLSSLINGAADLPGPGAMSFTGTIERVP